jgi:hypothetical protein
MVFCSGSSTTAAVTRISLSFRQWLVTGSYIGDVLQTMLDDAETS